MLALAFSSIFTTLSFYNQSILGSNSECVLVNFGGLASGALNKGKRTGAYYVGNLFNINVLNENVLIFCRGSEKSPYTNQKSSVSSSDSETESSQGESKLGHFSCC